MKDATLSVLMPVWNGGAFLPRAIESALRARCVSEIVIVDDGSDDDSVCVASAFGPRVRVFKQERSGPAAARNFALARARGQIIAFLDADDWWNEGYPDYAFEELSAHGADVISARTQCFICAPDGTCESSGPAFESLQLGSLICRREVFARAGEFDPTLRQGEDLDWFLRVREAGCAVRSIEATALCYCLHSGNRTKIHRASRAGLLAALHRATERKRIGAPVQTLDISVIIPAYNAERYLADAIRSVVAQTLAPREVIVVDDGSSDRTRNIASEFPNVRIVTQENRGAGAARNAGVRASRGAWLAFLDADDLWLPEKLRVQAAHLAQHAELEAVFAHVVEFSNADTEEDSPVAAPIPGTVLIRREAFERIGDFDESSGAMETADWFLRAREQSLRCQILPDVLYRRRLHEHNRGIVTRNHATLKPSKHRLTGAARPVCSSDLATSGARVPARLGAARTGKRAASRRFAAHRHSLG